MASPEKAIEQLLTLPHLPGKGAQGDLVAHALRTAIVLLDGDTAVAAIGSAADKGDRLVLYAGSDAPAALPSNFGASEVCQQFARKRQAIALADLSETPAFAPADACPGVDAGPVLYAPVDQRGEAPAYLAVYRRRGRGRYTANETELLILLAAWLGAALENLRLTAGAERLALTDETTQIYNSRFVKTALKRETRRADRHAQELSLVMVEIDGLDAFREAHGKTRTARLLKEIAALFGKQVRSFDVLGKDGADGFLLLLPQTEKSDALDVAERMRTALESCAFAPAPAGAVTATFGVATFPHEGHDVEALLAVVERALERGRSKGRNCVAVATREAA